MEDLRLRFNPYSNEKLAKLKTWSQSSEFEWFLDWLRLYAQEQKISQWDLVSDDLLQDTKKRIQVLDSVIRQIGLFPKYIENKSDPQKVVKAIGNSLQENKK